MKRRATARGRQEVPDLVVVQAVAVTPTPLPGGDPPHVHPLAAAEAAESGLIWKQDDRGLWHAKGNGGTYYAIPKPSGFEVLWIGTDGNQILLGQHETLPGAFQTARRFLPERAAAEVVPVLHEGPSEAAEVTDAHVSEGIGWTDLGRDPERQAKLIKWADRVGKLDTPIKVYEVVGPWLHKQKQEVFLVILLDVHGKPSNGVCEVAKGQRDRVQVSIADVMQKVLQSGAKSFIVVHNHPSGKARPSPSDERLTKGIDQAAFLYRPDIAFDDHVIVGVGELFSFKHGGLKRLDSRAR
jgi:hypothetical protein